MQHPVCLTLAVKTLRITVERQLIHGHIFNIDLQHGREAQIPERSRHDDPVRIPELMGIAETGMVKLLFRQQSIPLRQGIRVQKLQSFFRKDHFFECPVRMQIAQCLFCSIQKQERP